MVDVTARRVGGIRSVYRPTLHDRSQACRDILRHGESLEAVARKYEVSIPTLKAWLRVAKARAKLHHTRDGYPPVPYSY
jgi:transposase-like protein